MIRQKNDILWKSIMEEVFDDLLRFLFPKADSVFDMERGFQFLDKELSEMYPEPDKRSDTRFVDKLVKVYQRNGAEEWVLVHVEVQGAHDPQFPKRMFRYYCRIFDRYDRPVTAIAIFTGKDGKNMTDRYECAYEGSELTYKYNTLYITDYDDKVLAESDNPFALVLLAAKKALMAGKEPDEQLLQQKILILKLLYRNGLFDKRKIKAILSFLHNYVRFAKPETNRIFINEIDLITGKKNTMDIFEQVAELRAEEALERERRIFVKNLLSGTRFSVEKIAALANVPVEFVSKIKKRMKVK